MKLIINSADIPDNGGAVDYLERRVAFALARTKHIIQSTVVTVSDVDKVESGIDKQCQVVIKRSGFEDIVVSERQADLRMAIDRSIARASQRLLRQLKRDQFSRRSVHRSKLKPISTDDH